MTASTRRLSSIARGPRRRGWRGFLRGKRRVWMAVSLLSFWMALAALALPLVAQADANSLGAYGATASGWAIQPYILNDSFLNVPAADQAAPYVFVSMDNIPGARAKASYFFPGTAVNAVPNTQGVPVTVPDGVEARYPGNGSASGQLNAFNDGVATQATAGAQSAQASEGYALAQAAIANYQFAPTIPAAPVSPPGGVTLPTPPPVPTIPSGAPTATPGSSGGATATPTAPASGATPTATSCTIICLSSSFAAGEALPQQAARSQQGLVPINLPDNLEQQLTASLRALEAGNPSLLTLAGGHLPTTNPALPYAGADISSQAETRATDSGVVVTVVTHLQNTQLLQGLITFTSIDSSLQAAAPASGAKGGGAITTQVIGAMIAGIPVTVDENGVTVDSQNLPANQIQSLSDQLNAALAKVGLHMSLTKTVTKIDTGFWEGSGAGLEVTAELNPAGTGLPSPASGIPATHIDFSIGKVVASIYATPGSASGSGSGGGYSGGSCCFGSSGGPSGSGAPLTPSRHSQGSGSFLLPGGLSGGALLALVFVIQGLSTAAAAATAGYADSKAKSGLTPTEEETK